MAMIVIIAVVTVWLAAFLARKIKMRIVGFFAGWIGALLIAGIAVPLFAMYLEELAGNFDGDRMVRALANCFGIALFYFPVQYWMIARKE